MKYLPYPCILVCVLIFSASVVFAQDFDEQRKMLAGDGATGDDFGYAVSLSGDYALVGACGDDSDAGSAYLFVWNGSAWIQQAHLKASDASANDYFGISVSLSGKTAVVGAYGKNSYTGAVYIFDLTNLSSSMTETAKLTAADGAAGDYFGVRAQISGNRIIVGAYGDESKTGSAYIFAWNGSGWYQQAKLTASDGAVDDQFGSSVEISGTWAVVGAYGDENSTGAVYLFNLDTVSTDMTENKKLTASDGQAGDYFGASVSIDDNHILVGAPMDESQSGSAYAFVRNNSVWSQQAKLTPTSPTALALFGSNLDLSDNYAVIGAVGFTE